MYGRQIYSFNNIINRNLILKHCKLALIYLSESINLGFSIILRFKFMREKVACTLF